MMRTLWGIVFISALMIGVLPEGRAREGAEMILGLILISWAARGITAALQFR